jgi:UDP-N-acetylmuramoyl-L-alanyl-D-glutamate--2,6-diaminopimelate ligase
VPPGPYLVAGLGRAGLAAAHALADYATPAAVTACDSATFPEVMAAKRELEERGINVVVGESGTAAVQTEPPPGCVVKSPGISFAAPLIATATSHGIAVLDEAELAWRLDDRPLVAVTGTNGKSTTCQLLRAVLEAAGRRPILGGNAQFDPPLSALPRQRGAIIVGEISSFQLEGCPDLLPEAAVFTNLSLDHLDRHGTLHRYGECKRRLFVREDRCVPVAAVNVGEPFGAHLASELGERGATVVRYGGADADFRVARATWSLDRGWLSVVTPAGELDLDVHLPGRHNADNVLAALAAAHGLGIDPEPAARAIEAAHAVPGRFERVDGTDEVDVIVDYAHNPGGIRAALQTARHTLTQRPGARMTVVLSALAIDAEPQRRAMGRAAAELADALVLTTERWAPFEPRDRLPMGLEEGAREPSGTHCDVVLERRDAIDHAIRSAAPGDVVLVLGRGAQAELLFDGHGHPHPFDDRIEARRALARVARR